MYTAQTILELQNALSVAEEEKEYLKAELSKSCSSAKTEKNNIEKQLLCLR